MNKVQRKTNILVIEQLVSLFSAEQVVWDDNDDSTRLLNHLQIDSREVRQNDVFIAMQGVRHHGLDFIAQFKQQNQQQQPQMIIADKALTPAQQQACNNMDCQVVVVKSLQKKLGALAAWFYDDPSHELKVVGITGTNGKTSSAFFTAQWLTALGEKVALMGTLGNGLLTALQPSVNTTPNPVVVHKSLRAYQQMGVTWVVMEVSSHALVLERVQGVRFATVALTQVSRDHLDFHGSEKAYQQAKECLFTEYFYHHAVVNLSDPLGKRLYEKLRAQTNVWGYEGHCSTHLNRHAQLACQQLQFTPQGFQLMAWLQATGAETPWQSYACKAHLLGAFNVENILCAASILLVNGFKAEQVFANTQKLVAVPGRMQQLEHRPAEQATATTKTRVGARGPKNLTILIDFAHTPDALRNVLQSVQVHGQNKAQRVIIFGCGGDRDVGKRPLMGAVAEQLAEQIVVTSDNPRSEPPDQIANAILKGMQYPDQACVELDRKQAIWQTLERLALKSTPFFVVIAGKGHENTQESNGVKMPFSDMAVVKEWLAHYDNTQGT